MKILATLETETPSRIWRRRLTTEHGIQVEILLDGQPLPENVLYVGLLAWSVYRYAKPSDGKPVWGIEVERFEGPDVQWWTTWLLDGNEPQPDVNTVLALIEAGPEPGH